MFDSTFIIIINTGIKVKQVTLSKGTFSHTPTPLQVLQIQAHYSNLFYGKNFGLLYFSNFKNCGRLEVLLILKKNLLYTSLTSCEAFKHFAVYIIDHVLNTLS